MSYELDGTLKAIFPTQTLGKGFTKREFIVTTTNDRFPQDIKFELVKDRVGLVDSFKEGQAVKVSFDLRGGEYNGKYFVNLNAWKIQPGSPDAAEAQGGAPARQNPNRQGGGPPRSGSGGQGGGYQGNRPHSGGQPRSAGGAQGQGSYRGGQGQGQRPPQQRQAPPPPSNYEEYPDELDEPRDGIPF